MPLRIGPFYLGQPTAQERKDVVDSCASLPFNFPHVGVTRGCPPLPEDVAGEGWTIGHHRVQVGRGRRDFERARGLLQAWRHFELGWAYTNAPVVKPGAPVVVTARSLLLWSCNPLRVTWVEEGPAPLQHLRLGNAQQQPQRAGKHRQPAPARAAQQQQRRRQPAAAAVAARAGGGGGRRFGFGHTTLAGHQITGEECFNVRWEAGGDDSVWYEIYTLSRPATPLAALFRPLLRHYQARFAAQSMAAMAAQVGPAAPGGRSGGSGS